MNAQRQTDGGVVVRSAQETLEGAGAVVRRLFPVAGLRNLDPFVLWDHFSVQPGSGFPDHPHRGFEGITYLLAGSMQHADNLGNRTTVTTGGAQRFTAGRGIVHSEMPGDSGETRGIQLWVRLPYRLQDTPPDYQQVDAADFPVRHFDGGWQKTLVGEGSPLRLFSPVHYSDLGLNAEVRHAQVLPAGSNGLVYLLEGVARVAGETLQAGQAALLRQCAEVTLEAVTDCRLLLCFGQPHGEPIVQHGPFVD